MLIIVGIHTTTYASGGGLDGAVITGPNEITVTYEHVLTNNTPASYSNLGGGLMGRTIVSATTDPDSNHIVLEISGPSILAPNANGTIDIDNTVAWDGGNFAGQTGVPVIDGLAPSLSAVKLVDNDDTGTLTAGDVLSFGFSEPMNKTTVTTSNVDTELSLSNGHTFGSTGHGLAVSWNTVGTVLNVTLGTDNTIASGDSVSAASAVTDLAGNLDNTPLPFDVPVTLPPSRTLYFNAAQDNDWGNLNNWWNDSGFTDPATSIPTPYDNVVVSGNVYLDTAFNTAYVNQLTVVGQGGNPGDFGSYIQTAINVGAFNRATFNGASLNYGTINADVTFNDFSIAGVPVIDMSLTFGYGMINGDVTFTATTANYGTIDGSATFNGDYGNAGLINGTAVFHDATSNPGEVVGHATFYENTHNGGFFGFSPNVAGDADVYFPSNNPIDGVVTGNVSYHGYNNPFSGGIGTVEDPYIITSCDQLQQMTYDLSAHYKLDGEGGTVDCSATSSWNSNSDEWVDGVIGGTLIPDSYASVTHTDIVVTNNGYAGFLPVGDDTTPFTGTLDGNNNTISNLWIFRKGSDYNGLFGEMNGGSVHDLTLSNSNIVGRQFTGGLFGKMSGTHVTNVTLDHNMVRAYLNTFGGGLVGYLAGDAAINHVSNIDGSVHGSGNIIGGLVGLMNGGIIDQSSSSASVDGGLNIGGIVGELDNGTITNTIATGNVLSNRSEYIVMKTGANTGGFVGYIGGGSISHSHATGTVTTTGDYSGGFVGFIGGSTTISDSYATGNVTGNSETINGTLYTPNYMGGFVGYELQSTFTNDYATGDVTAPGEEVGGFVGNSSCGVGYTNSYATGNVSGMNYVGGFVGFDGCQGPGATFSQTFAHGTVTATGDLAGGFAGALYSSTVNDAYATGAVTGTTNVGGFAGQIESGTINNVFESGAVVGTDAGTNGGLVGSEGDATVSNSFWDNQTSGQDTSPVGTGLATSLMKDKATFLTAGWNFDNVWNIQVSVNNNYPDLQYYSPSTPITIPAVSTTSPLTEIGQTSATLKGYLNNGGGAVVTTGFRYGTNPDTVVSHPNLDENYEGTPILFIEPITGLACGTTYYYQAYGTNTAGTGTGDMQSFQTTPCSVSGLLSGGNSNITWTPINGFVTKVQNLPVPSVVPQTVQITQIQTQAHTIVITSTLKIGSNNIQVKKLQQYLNSHGFIIANKGKGSKGHENSSFGTLTKKAVMKFQKAHGLSVDGIVNEKVRALINTAL